MRYSERVLPHPMGTRPLTSDSRHKLTSGEPAPRVLPDRAGPLHVELIAVGRDLLHGRVADDNSRHLADYFSRRGTRVHRATVVDDDTKAIVQLLRETLARNPHLVVMTGGLGAATDDVTLEAVAAALEQPLSVSPRAKSMVEAGYQRMHRARQTTSAAMTRTREKLYRIPVGSEPIDNPKGPAPGVVIKLPAGAAVICLPGMPREMKAVLEVAVAEVDEHWHKRYVAHRDVEAPSADESAVVPLLARIADEFPEVWISSRPTVGKTGHKVYLSIEVAGDSEEAAEATADKAVKRLLALVSGAS